MSDNWQRSAKVLELVNLDTPLLIINAPAGCGKTALAAQYARAISPSPIWITLDGRDKDPSHMMRHLIKGIGNAGHNAARELGKWGSPAPTYEDFAAAFVESIDRSSSIFIDDFHKISGSAQSVVLINSILSRCAAKGVFAVLTSRSTSGLKFADLLMRGSAVELGFDAIAFSEDEISQLYSEQFGLAVSREQVIEIQRNTSGWAICVAYLGRLLSRQEHHEWGATLSSMRGNAVVGEYLAEQVLDGLTSSLQRNLFLCALPLHGNTGVLVDSGLICASDLRELELTGVFTSSYDSSGHASPMLHPIIRSCLRDGIETIFDSDHLTLIHRRIGEGFSRTRELTRALHHFQLAREWTQFREVLAQLSASLKDTGEYETYIYWASRLPSELATWKTSSALADACFHLEKIPESLDLIVAAINMADTSGDTSGAMRSRMEHAKILQWCDVNDEKIDMLMRQIDSLAPDRSSRVEVEAHLVRANNYCSASQFYETARIIRFLRSSIRNYPDELSIARLRTFEACFQFHVGRFDKGNQLIGQAADVFRDEDQLNYGMCLNGMATAATEMDAAPDELLNLIHRLDGFVLAGTRVRIDALGTCAQIYLSLQEISEALTKLQQMRDEKGQQGTDYRYTDAYLHFIRYYRVNQDLDEMQRYLKLISLDNQTEQQLILARIEAALAKIALGDRRKGLADLDVLEKKAAKQMCRVSLAHIWYAKGKLALEDGHTDNATSYLTRTLHQSRKGNRSYWLRMEAQGDPRALVFALQEGIYADFVEKILIRAGESAARAIAESVNGWPNEAKLRGLHVLGEIGDKTTVAAVRRELRSRDGEVKALARETMAKLAPPQANPAEFILTCREREILALIASGARNKEIAESVFIAEATVKTHVNRIFHKLGVSQRVQAAVYYRDNFLE